VGVNRRSCSNSGKQLCRLIKFNNVVIHPRVRSHERRGVPLFFSFLQTENAQVGVYPKDWSRATATRPSYQCKPNLITLCERGTSELRRIELTREISIGYFVTDKRTVPINPNTREITLPQHRSRLCSIADQPAHRSPVRLQRDTGRAIEKYAERIGNRIEVRTSALALWMPSTSLTSGNKKERDLPESEGTNRFVSRCAACAGGKKVHPRKSREKRRFFVLSCVSRVRRGDIRRDKAPRDISTFRTCGKRWHHSHTRIAGWPRLK